MTTLPMARSLVDAPRRAAGSFQEDVLDGLRRRHKRIACKYFYDPRGSELFEKICSLPEYYLTRTELMILQQNARAIARSLGSHALLIELGSGSSTKTRFLLDQLIDPIAYVPIDISPAALVQAARKLSQAYPRLPVMPLCADYTTAIALPDELREMRRRVVFFPGSTIGNFEPPAAGRFLRRMRNLCGEGGSLLIGVDLKKDPRILHAAYNDAAGVTARFNLNLLARINRELGADFDLAEFIHHAFYQPSLGRIEMHLLSRRRQVVRLGGWEIELEPFESIHTENSYKYDPDGFESLCAGAGFGLEQTWLDERRWFAVFHFRAGG